MHARMFRKTEPNVKGSVPIIVRYAEGQCFYNRNMGMAPQFDWYLSDWMDSAGMSQADLRKKTGWSKRKASDLCEGGQRYNRDAVNEAATALNLYPYELLMHPSDAMAVRQLRDGGLKLASSPAKLIDAGTSTRNGTDG